MGIDFGSLARAIDTTRLAHALAATELPAAASSTAAAPMAPYVAPPFVPSLQAAVLGLVSPTASAVQAPLAELVAGTEPLPFDYDMGLLSGDVYSDDSAGSAQLNGWMRITAMPEGTELPPGCVMDPETGVITGPNGFRAAIYQRGEPPEYVVAYAGSGDAKDWVTNGEGAAAGMVPTQHYMAMQLADSMVRAYPGQVVFTGHSLGGGLAAASALATGAPAVTFNAAGIDVEGDTLMVAAWFRNEGDPAGEWTADSLLVEANTGVVRNYHVRGDVLTVAQEHDMPADLPDAIGHQIEVERHAGISTPWGNHGIGTAIDAIGSSTVIAYSRGSTVEIVHGEPRYEVVSVTFEDSDEGRAAQRVYATTGELPEDMVGVNQVITTPFTLGWDDVYFSESTVTTYDGDGNVVAEAPATPAEPGSDP